MTVTGFLCIQTLVTFNRKHRQKDVKTIYYDVNYTDENQSDRQKQRWRTIFSEKVGFELRVKQ